MPVMVVNSELEAIACYEVRQPDTDRFRYWESAGTCHVAIQSMDVRAPKYEREFGVAQPVMQQMNRIAITPLYDAALHHLNRWVGGGEAPPVQPLIEFAGDPAEVVRDEHGIAVGGVRLPQADVPVAQNSAIPLGQDIYSMLWGSSHPVRRREARRAVRRRGRLHRAVHEGGAAPPSTPACSSPATSSRPSTEARSRVPPRPRRRRHLNRRARRPYVVPAAGTGASTSRVGGQSLVKRCSRNGSPYMW